MLPAEIIWVPGKATTADEGTNGSRRRRPGTPATEQLPAADYTKPLSMEGAGGGIVWLLGRVSFRVELGLVRGIYVLFKKIQNLTENKIQNI
jgi:hypothetical protein